MRSRFVRVCRSVPLLVAVLLLAGCLKLDADLTIGTDDTVTGTYVVAYKKDPKTKPPGLPSARQLLVTSGSAEARPYDDGQYLGTEYRLERVPFADLAAFTAVTVGGRQTGTIQLTRDGDDVLVAGTFDFRETSSVKRTPQQEADARKLFSVRVRLAFPGDVQTANGTIDGRVVTWTIPAFQRTTLQARAGAVAPVAQPVSYGGSGDAARYTLWGGIGLAAVALLLGLLLLVRRMRRPEPAAAAPPGRPSDFDWVIGERTREERARSRPPEAGPWDRTVAGPPAPEFRPGSGYAAVPGHAGPRPDGRQGAWPGTGAAVRAFDEAFRRPGEDEAYHRPGPAPAGAYRAAGPPPDDAYRRPDRPASQPPGQPPGQPLGRNGQPPPDRRPGQQRPPGNPFRPPGAPPAAPPRDPRDPDDPAGRP